MKKTLVIPGQLPSLNQYTKECRSYKLAGAQMKKRSEKIISACIQQQLQEIHFEGTVKLAFRWYEATKKRDLDNICFAKKFILDALVNNRTIQADGWKGVVGFTDNFFLDRENPRIEVDIEEVGEEV